MDPIRVAIVEDEPLLRHLLASALEAAGGIEIVGAFADPEAALAAIPSLAPCVVLTEARFAAGSPRAPVLTLDRGADRDAQHPAPMDGFAFGRALRRRLPDVGIVLLSDRCGPEPWTALPPEETVGWSYLLKRSVHHVDTIVQTIRGTRDGLVVLDPEVMPGLNGSNPVARLTGRQRQVLKLMAEGFTNGAIAARLSLSEKTIQNQINLIYDKLAIDRCGDVQPRVRAAVTYWQYR